MDAWLIITIAAAVAISLIVAIVVAVVLRQIAFEVSGLLELEPTALPRRDRLDAARRRQDEETADGGSLDTSDGSHTAPATPEPEEAHGQSSPPSERQPYHRMR